MIPDRKSERSSPFHTNHQIVFPKFYLPDGTPFAGDPRYQLEKALEELKKLGYELKIGLEIEFYIFKDNMEILESHVESSLSSLVDMIDDFDAIYSKLKEADVNVEIIHKEVGSG